MRGSNTPLDTGAAYTAAQVKGRPVGQRHKKAEESGVVAEREKE